MRRDPTCLACSISRGIISVIDRRGNVALVIDLTLDAYGQLIAQTREALTTYNALLERLDQTHLNFKALEQCLIDMSEGVLTGIATHYGNNSTEYEMVSGTDNSEQQCSRSQSEPGTPDLAKD